MTALLLASMHSIVDAESGDQSFRLISLFSCCGLAASLGLVALGVDLSPAWL
jgi:hypothetical protein